MLFYGKTDIGRRREMNQDDFIIRKYADDVLAAVVCDGMGGANGGNVASKVAVETFIAELDAYEREHPSFFGESQDDIVDCLSSGVAAANRAVYKLASTDASLTGMGTTLVACIVSGEKGYIVNVGDSRLYLIEDGEIEQVTHDHSYVQDLIDFGQITLEEAKHHSRRNIITRVVGTQKTVAEDLFVCEMKPGTYAVLCSDGLTNHVEPEEICEMVSMIGNGGTGTIEDACAALIDCANSRGGHDNITAVILSI